MKLLSEKPVSEKVGLSCVSCALQPEESQKITQHRDESSCRFCMAVFFQSRFKFALRHCWADGNQYEAGVREGRCQLRALRFITGRESKNNTGDQPDMTVLHNKPLNVVLQSIESPYRIFILGGLTANWRLPPPHRPYQKDLLRTHGRTSKSNLE